MSPLAEALVAPLDRARGGVLRAVTRWPIVRRVVARRDARLAVQATLGVASAFALTAAAPVFVLALSPILLGVPHVASDVRYLVLRRSLPRGWVIACVVACGALFVARAADLVWPAFPVATVEGGLAFAWLLGAAAAGARAGRSWLRAALLFPPLLALLGLAAAHPRHAQLVFLHLHNVVAIVLWVVLFRRRPLPALAPIVAVVAGACLLASGVTLGVADLTSFGLSLDEASLRIMPLGGADLALRLTLIFVFLQAVHYAAWLVWIPQDELVGEGTRTYRQTARGLGRDFGRLGLLAIGAAMLLVGGAALLDLHRARTIYLSLASFHGVLEVATLVFLLGAGRARPAAR